MSKHCWYRPQNLGTQQCMKCGLRRPNELVLYAMARTPLGVLKKECPGLSRQFRRAMRRYVRDQHLKMGLESQVPKFEKERNHGRDEIQ